MRTTQGVLVERPEFDRPGRRASDKRSLFYSIPLKYWAHGSAPSIMSGHESRYNRPSTDSNEERKQFLSDHDGSVPLEAHLRQRKRFQRVIIAQWVVMGILAFILIITIPMLSRNTNNYWIPNEIYCILLPCFSIRKRSGTNSN